ncbi:MAG: nucleoside hydrolase [Saprospiraceae bacterium]
MTSKRPPKPTPVIFNHSAAIDDFVSQAVLHSMTNIDLKGIVVTIADCIATPAMESSSKVHQFLGLDKQKIPLTMSMTRGWNAFPWEYKKDCIAVNGMKILKSYKTQTKPPYENGETMIEMLLLEAIIRHDPVIYLVTGPVTALTTVLKKRPELKAGIKKIVWMGGAINVPGNLDPNTIPPEVANKKAEWNAFWDPFAVTEMFETFSDIHIFPLDITDQAKITDEFKKALTVQSKKYNLTRFVKQCYDLVKDAPYYEMWNTCATCSIGNSASSIYGRPKRVSLKIEEWGDDTQGWIRPSRGKNYQNVYLKFRNQPAFYEYVLDQLKMNV